MENRCHHDSKSIAMRQNGQQSIAEKEVNDNACYSSKGENDNHTLDCCDTRTQRVNHAGSNCCGTQPQSKINQLNHKANDTSKQLTHSTQTTAYHISGMDCPSCAVTIEKGLNRLANIQEAKVIYPTAKLHVSGNNALSLESVENEVKRLGFTVEPLHQNTSVRTYDVIGMDCGSCAMTIEKHLNTLPAVHTATVNFSTGKMKVQHDNSIDDILTEVGKLGFEASPVTDINKPTNKKMKKNGYGLITLSGILIATGFVGTYIGFPIYLSTLLYAIAMIISGYKPIKSAFFAVKSRSLDMNVLMSAAAIGAAIIGEWFEGATVVFLFSLGNALQYRSMEHTRKSISDLINLAPEVAWVKENGELVKQPVNAITIGATIVVKPGERIPLDGKIIQGITSINQAPITGESIPVDKQIGDSVFAGTINEHGSMDVKVTKHFEETSLSNIIHLVEEAQEQKAPAQAFIDRFASIYTPIVFVLAITVMTLPPLFGFGTWGAWAYKGLALLVVACPCALVISTPVAIVSAIGNAAKHGVLIKGGTFLEKAGTMSAMAFDKTGTLTEGKPKIADIKAFTVSEDELLSLAYTLEDYSTHPIAKTIVAYAKNQGASSKQGHTFKNIVGQGVQATIDNQVFYAGNLRLFEHLNAPVQTIKTKINTLQNQGKTTVVIGTEKEIMGIITVADQMRNTAIKALKGLQEAGIKQLVMLTGDNEGTAKVISKESEINRYFANLMPEDKVKAIKQLQSEGQRVAMVGDGINDAPALATADLGIAMGGAGTDTAMETADIVLMADNLEKLPYTMKLSRKALTIIKQNIWFAIVIKLAALVLIFPGILTLWMAVLSDTGAAILVILNALRLMTLKN